MMNYKSLYESLHRRGFRHTNSCSFDGKTYNDFTNPKTRETASAVIDPVTGAVSVVEVTRPCWDDHKGMYVPVKDTYTSLESLINRIK